MVSLPDGAHARLGQRRAKSRAVVGGYAGDTSIGGWGDWRWKFGAELIRRPKY